MSKKGGGIIRNNCVCKRLEDELTTGVFHSYYDFIKLERDLHSMVLSEELEEVSFHKEEYWERIFRCKECKKLWKLTEPEAHFKGNWRKIDG